MAKAYEGKEPYIFISYSHKDLAAAQMVIDSLIENGFRVWYDNGIEAGTEWPEYIAERMMSCGVVIALMSKNAQDSHNCRREIHFAIELKKELLVVYLEDFELSPGMRLQLSALQAMYRSKFKNDAEFLEHLRSAAILQSCRAAKSNASHSAQQKTAERYTSKDDTGAKKQTQGVNNDEYLRNSIRSHLNTYNSTSNSTSASPKGYESKKTNMRNAILAAVESCNAQLKAEKRSFFFKEEDMKNERKKSNAISAYAKGISSTKIIAIMDDTLFGSAKSGYLVTDTNLYSGGMLLANFNIYLPSVRKARSNRDSHVTITFEDGSEKEYYFNNYYNGFLKFFETFINEMGYSRRA